MKYEEYLEKRNELTKEAQNLIDSGEIEKANEKMQDVRDLDEKWDETAKAQANMRALEGKGRKINVQNLSGNPEGDAETQERIAMGNMEKGTDLTNKSETYKRAWAKSMMGLKMTQEEMGCYQAVNDAYANMTNAYTHTTDNTAVIIPETVAKGIWEEVGKLFPYWGDIHKTYVPGALSMIKDDESTDAGWYEEDTATEDGKETFAKLMLNGCELSRAITVSWKLKEMAMEDFIPYIQRRMAAKMGAGLGYGATHGKGQPGTGDTFKPEPMGTVTALEKEANTPQIVEYVAGSLKYTDLTKARGKIKSGYAAGLNVYANSNTIWNELANIQDENGRPILMADVANGGVYRVLSMIVKEDDSMKDGEILMSNPQAGCVANINKDISMTTEDHAKARTTDYCGYAIVDMNITTSKAHALLKVKATAGKG